MLPEEGMVFMLLYYRYETVLQVYATGGRDGIHVSRDMKLCCRCMLPEEGMVFMLVEI